MKKKNFLLLLLFCKTVSSSSWWSQLIGAGDDYEDVYDDYDSRDLSGVDIVEQGHCFCSGQQCPTGYLPCQSTCPASRNDAGQLVQKFKWAPGEDQHCPYCCNDMAGSCGFSVACCRVQKCPGTHDQDESAKVALGCREYSPGQWVLQLHTCVLPTEPIYQFDHEVYVDLDAGQALLPSWLLQMLAMVAVLAVATSDGW